MAISTYKTFLMHKASSSYTKLVDITSFPDLGGDPEMVETTTLSDPMRTFINGIKNAEAMSFDCNYDATDYATLKALENQTQDYAVWFGGTDVEGGKATPTGDQGKFTFKGQLSVRVAGGGVNAAVGMTVTIAPSSPIGYAAE